MKPWRGIGTLTARYADLPTGSEVFVTYDIVGDSEGKSLLTPLTATDGAHYRKSVWNKRR
jgi:hypothetical protein